METKHHIDNLIFDLLQELEDDMQENIVSQGAEDGWEKAIRFVNTRKNKIKNPDSIWDKGLVYKYKTEGP